MRNSTKIILGSLLGSIVITAITSSCTSASADSSCSAWQVSTFGAGYAVALGSGAPVDVPGGWEPISIEPLGFGTSSGILVGLRRCTP